MSLEPALDAGETTGEGPWSVLVVPVGNIANILPGGLMARCPIVACRGWATRCPRW